MADDFDWTKLMLGLAICYTVLGALSVSANTVVAYTILSSAHLRKTRFYLMLLCMAIGAWFFGVGSVISGSLRIDQLTNGSLPLNLFTQTQCMAISEFFFFGGMYYEFMMLVIASERFYAIMAPMHYRVYGEQFTGKAVIFTTVLCLVASFAGFIGTDNENRIPLCNLSAAMHKSYYPVFMLGFCNMPGVLAMAMYLVAWLMSKTKVTDNLLKSAEQKHELKSAAMDEQQRRRHKSLTKLVTSIVLVYTLTSGLSIPLATAPNFLPSPAWGALQKGTFVSVAGCLICINTILDLFVYVLRSGEMRTAVRSKFSAVLPGELPAPSLATVSSATAK